ncbi:hypothetical protein BDD12DRAFT_982532, partial [Trichophaea hybrida]
MATNKGKIYVPKLYHYFIKKPRKPKRIATITYLEEKIAQVLGERIVESKDKTPEPGEETPKPQDNFDSDIDYSDIDFNPWDDSDIELHGQETAVSEEEEVEEEEEEEDEEEEEEEEKEEKEKEQEEKIVEHQQDNFDPDIDYSAVDFNPWDHVGTTFHDGTILLPFDKPIQPISPDQITQLLTDVLTTSIKEKHVVDHVAVKNYGENILVQVLTVSKVSYGDILETIRGISPSCMISGALGKEYELRQLFVQKFYNEKKP